MYKEKVPINCKKCGRAIIAEIPENNHSIYNQLLLNILQAISQKYGHNL